MEWKRGGVLAYDNKCAITGLPVEEVGVLSAHHLYSVKNYPHLIYVVQNGILISQELHRIFHNMKKYYGNTIDQFREFLVLLLWKQSQESMLISSQANSGGLEGSETRVYDPDRVMELHERLGEIKEFLDSISETTQTIDPSVGPISESDSDSDSDGEN